jgi:hypothetical protein
MTEDYPFMRPSDMESRILTEQEYCEMQETLQANYLELLANRKSLTERGSYNYMSSKLLEEIIRIGKWKQQNLKVASSQTISLTEFLKLNSSILKYQRLK